MASAHYMAPPPKGMIWKVREKCDSTILGELKVYLFQDNPNYRFITWNGARDPFFEAWRKGLNTKISEYNQSQYHNIQKPQIPTPEYTINETNNKGNFNHFFNLLEKFSRETTEDFCGTQMNRNYISSSILDNNYI